MKRIMIIGRSGSGKTVFADKLGKGLGREVIHLDKLYWKPGWVEAFPNRQEWEKKIDELISNDEWILDGNFRRTIEKRLQRADTVIFFNVYPWRSLYFAYKRKFFPPKLAVDKHENMPEKVTWDLIKLIFSYPTKWLLKLLAKTENKKVYIVRNHKQANELLQRLIKNN